MYVGAGCHRVSVCVCVCVCMCVCVCPSHCLSRVCLSVVRADVATACSVCDIPRAYQCFNNCCSESVSLYPVLVYISLSVCLCVCVCVCWFACVPVCVSVCVVMYTHKYSLYYTYNVHNIISLLFSDMSVPKQDVK